jgi:hypothetical protein
MTGIALLFAVGIIAVIVIWSIVNDRVAPDGRTTGLLAMRDAESTRIRSDSPDEPANEKRSGDAPDSAGI